MARYAIWNKKGGIGKSRLTFQISYEYAIIHPHRKEHTCHIAGQKDSIVNQSQLDKQQANIRKFVSLIE